MVSEQVGEGVGLWHGVLPHGNSTRACEIILGDFIAFFLVVSVDEEDGLAVDDGFYALSIAARLCELFGAEQALSPSEENMELVRCKRRENKSRAYQNIFEEISPHNFLNINNV
jgi:hypothetical protein